MDGSNFGGALVPRATVAQIVAPRNQALDLFEKAHRALMRASKAVQAAQKEVGAAAPTRVNSYNFDSQKAKDHFLTPIKVPSRDDYMTQAKRLTDTEVWAHVVELTELEHLMDRTAKDELRQQLMTEPPEATEENIFATLMQFAADANLIFKRGIATCFADLDRRFRSHDGWKLGSRIILDRAFNEHGSWCYYGRQRDTMIDVERTFRVLDGRPMNSNYGSLIYAIENDRRGKWQPHQSVTETEYFKICVYKNGNAHLWFKRDDLVRQVNQLLGEYYGAPLTDQEPDTSDDGDLFKPKTELAKNYAFFPTPDGPAEEVIRQAIPWRSKEDPPLTILEPSAGTGNLARRCIAKPDPEKYAGRMRDEIATDGNIVDCVEVHPERAQGLRDEGVYRRVIEGDFLLLQPDPANLYDRVVMNPPFDRERDIDHVMHALEFLKPDGKLVAIMSAGTEFRETRKAVAFRELMAKMNANWHDLPEGSFAGVGTYMNTLTLTVCKDGHRHYYNR